VTFLFDANMPKVLASVLRDLGKSVSHTDDIKELGRGALDPRVIEYAADHNQIVVSRDLAMAKEPWFAPDVKRLGAGVFFIRTGKHGKELRLWPMAQLVFKGWDAMERFAEKNPPPFVALVKPNGTVVTYHG
jgi:hypothetical protein